ncbi:MULTISPECIES: primase-helicase family protein [unclassified Mesorhizobium]|uniref:primase-helicase family protein n=1 Tax=unclassified Mesorhizobium TaxID=325217 RepID=UPI000FCB861A|nr:MULTISPECIES: primase-helicase family protein [unclassified Mesorhizobium]TGP24986.1 hypothetical protein EN874_007680 [Mesorhizobium sp. M1D.F.Ca.ET.231.01.1.1]TGP36310.1 hypothetical protein EN877_07680 [Mesorhizobium sp. M1D.F.Ca.ET.234.01.1.1]TGS49813.1 hypothetical protein EN827_07680 [Mesorhizobium sp. M1D.F.Ca.ET.184.01.1.1]TGS64524.1 hypothetical protein EN826_007680 [Mesorhizobium sp. M1D.F.Ca.ET.183.01.1.1]
MAGGSKKSRPGAEVAKAALERMERPSDDDPDGQAEYDALAAEANGENVDDNGFNIDAFNRQFAVVPIGSRAVILWEKPDAPPEEQLQFLQISAFQTIYQNRFTEVLGADRKPKWKTQANAWLDSPRRRDFRGLEFFPDPAGTEGTPGFYNLWRGFSVDPRRGGSYAIFRDHILTNVCGGSEKTYAWFFGWFAQMMQLPREKPGTSIILRGPMGAGKTKIGEVFGSLIQAHYFQIDNPRYLIGQFNSHMAACLFLQADEAVFAGDKAAEGHLRGLVTSERQMVESKGIDPIRLPNYIRLMMTSNFDWVVPAGKEERRFACFDIAPHAKQNHEYFREMTEELDAGGREALLYDLLTFDLSKVNLREIPKTAALLEQKIRSFDPVEQWLYDRLHEGAIIDRGVAWPKAVECEALYKSYLATAEQMGIRYRVSQISFGMKIGHLLPGIDRVRRQVTDETGANVARRWFYALPPLADCRAAFDEQVGQRSDWGAIDDPE